MTLALLLRRCGYRQEIQGNFGCLSHMPLDMEKNFMALLADRSFRVAVRNRPNSRGIESAFLPVLSFSLAPARGHPWPGRDMTMRSRLFLGISPSCLHETSRNFRSASRGESHQADSYKIVFFRSADKSMKPSTGRIGGGIHGEKDSWRGR